jgi:hypothetical protein
MGEQAVSVTPIFSANLDSAIRVTGWVCVKNCPNCIPTHFFENSMHNFYRGKSSPNFGLCTCVITNLKTAQSRQSPNLVTLSALNWKSHEQLTARLHRMSNSYWSFVCLSVVRSFVIFCLYICIYVLNALNI